MMQKPMMRVFFLMTGVVVALGGFAERAVAQIPAADGTFYACVLIDRGAGEGKLARLVAANVPCRRNETRVHWSQTGPQGVPGTNGTNRTNGAPGINGTNGTRAEGPCFDNSHRYVNCGNGTVTDTVTGLIWLKQADCLPDTDYATANGAAAALKDGDCGGLLTDGSSAGDWRLPTKDEWSATIARAFALGCSLLGPGTAPSLTNDAGTACLSVGPSSFAGVAPVSDYWSSSTIEADPTNAWGALLSYGLVFTVGKVSAAGVWPVRGGPR